MKVIVVSGDDCAGKGTFMRAFIEFARERGILAFQFSTIDPVKSIYENFFEWDGEKTEEHRENLKKIKKMWVDICDGSFKYISRTLDGYDTIKADVVFVESREQKEIERILSSFPQYDLGHLHFKKWDMEYSGIVKNTPETIGGTFTPSWSICSTVKPKSENDKAGVAQALFYDLFPHRNEIKEAA